MRAQGVTSRRLVLVSHDRELRRQLRTCLSSLGMTAGALTTATSEYECLATLARTRPRLVVLDDSVIEPEGLALLRMLHQRNPEVLIVYLTTRHTVELERQVRQSGVLYYTEKPPDSLDGRACVLRYRPERAVRRSPAWRRDIRRQSWPSRTAV